MGGCSSLHRKFTRGAALVAVAMAAASTLPDASAATRPGAPQNPRATRVGATWVSLRWKPVAGARSYAVSRNGRVVLRVRTARATDARVPQGTALTYTVRAVNARGRSSAWSIPVPVTTRIAWPCTRVADSGGGSDANPGTPARPFRSAQRLANSLAPGVVGCLRGSFVEDVTIRRGGASGMATALRSAPGQRASLRGRLWIADTADYVVVQDLQLDGRNVQPGDLPSPTVQGDHVTFLRNDVTNANTAICFILGSVRGHGTAVSTVLDSNRVHHCGQLPAQNHHHGIYVESAVGARIVNNVIYANADRGIQLYPDAQRSIIARNVIDGNGQGIIFSGALGFASSGNRVVDNVVSNSRLRYNVEHFWPQGNPVGRRNVAARNCLWNGRQGDLSAPAVGYVALANRRADPGYVSATAGDFRAGVRSQCRALLSAAAPLTALR